MRIFRLSYFFPITHGQFSALNVLKQCLHIDPDSKLCLSAHRPVKRLDKSFTEPESLQSKEDWRGITNLLAGIGKTKGKAFTDQFDEAMEANKSDRRFQ
jgi:DnaJ homolog subfamily C member 3